MDLISVIIPVYNVEAYLRRCLDSVISQDYCYLEIILVDDGSPDNCPQICDEYAQKDRRIKVIHQPNRGLSSARNTGIAAAKGKYIMLVDSDDYVDSSMAGTMLHLIQRDNTDLAICSFRYVDEFESQTREDLQAYCPLKNGILGRNELLGLINTNVRGYWFYSVPFNKLYKSDVLKKLKYPESYLFEDEFMIHHLLGSIENASISEEQLYMYRQRAGSITDSNGYGSLKKMDFVCALEDRYRFFRGRGYNEYAKETADLLYSVFLKVVKCAFKSYGTYAHFLGKMLKISMVLIIEQKKSGLKLPVVYVKSFCDNVLFRKSSV